jgi:CheY-like chemotaxis protein
VPALAGLNVLIVDDEVLVKMLIADILDELGCRVADTASTLEEALAKAENGAFDAAILDVNLSGRRTDPVAAALAARRIPFLFSTGYGRPPSEEFAHVPVLKKPFKTADLEQALVSLAEAGLR